MNNENQKQILEKYKEDITKNLQSIENEYKKNIIMPNILNEFNNILTELKQNKIRTDFINNQLVNEHLYVFLFLLQEEGTRILGLKLIRNNIEIYPEFTNKLVNKLFPIIICKILEDYKSKNFNDRYECLKLINSWFNLSKNNFPLIFCQGIASMSKADEIFKKGSLEFLRILSLSRPDLCSSVGGFKILINSLLDVNNSDIQDYVLYSLLYVINSPNKRKYFNGFDDFYKIFSIFTKSDFTNKNNPKEKNSNKNNNDPNAIENEKKKIELSKNVIKKLLKTWTGYLLIMGDYMAMGSIIEALNTDTDDLIKSTVLNMFNDILNEEYDYIDNFINISSPSKDYFYTNKIFFAYIFQALEKNNFCANIMKFIENDNKKYNEFANNLALKYIILYSKISKNYQYKEINEEDLLDKIFYYYLSKDLSYVNTKNLSTEVILALHSMIVYFNTNKKYANQYSKESGKKELYSIDEKYLDKLITQSKVLDTKEYIKWDWRCIDSILEIIENKKLISDKQLFLKRLVNFYTPSKNEFVNNFWRSGKSETNKEFLIDAFSFGAIGNKLFNILASCPEGIIILKNKEDYIDDVINCLKNCLTENKKGLSIFGMEQIYSKMSRNIFSFIGILSSTRNGDEYLLEKGFYSILDKFVDGSNKFDYLLTTIIDNINFNSKNVNEWLEKLINKGSPQIKRYIFDHIRCYFQLKKELVCDIDLLLNSLSLNKDNCNNVIISILTSLLVKENNNYEINLTPELIDTISKIDKRLLFIMMRNKDCFELMEDFIEKEIKEINVDDLVQSYGNYLEESMVKIINAKDEDNKYHNIFLTINLSQIEEQYNKIHEFFVLKQLPFYIIILIKNKESKNIKESYILNTYMEYFSNDKIILHGTPRDNNLAKNIDFENSMITILWKLGDVNIDRMGKSIDNPEEYLISFSDNELNQGKKKKDNIELILLEKEGITLQLKQEQNNKKIFSLIDICCNIKINPQTKQYFKTPINILTELPNNEKGTEFLINIGAIEKLLNYLNTFNNSDTDIKNIKSALWILAKILIRDTTGKIEKKYQVIQKILKFNEDCSDYGMKGNIIYILCFISQKPSIKEYLKSNGYSYFFNTDICYPNDMQKLYIDNSTCYDNNKIQKDEDIILKKITLSKESETIFGNITNLINNIWSKTASLELDDTYKKEPQLFNDPNLLIKVYAALSKHNFKQPVRRKILNYFEYCLCSPEIIENASKILNDLGEDLLLSHELEE